MLATVPAEGGEGSGETYALLNYHMGDLGQQPWGGHVSPVAAFHAESDSFLILDCWFHSCPLWATTALIALAMTGLDTMSRKSRGVVFVRRDDSGGAPDTAAAAASL